MKKVLKIISIVVATLAIVYVICRVSTPVVYSKFFKASEKHASIPGLKDGFVPQGVSWMEKEALTIMCGYMPGDENSRMYLMGDEVRKINLLREDGSTYTGHAGGITNSGDYIYISNASKIFVIDKEKALATKDNDTLAFEGYFEVPCRASFCSSDSKYLYVGEYFAKGYETDETHKIATAKGENNAMVFAYELDAANPATYGIKDTATPAFCFSITDTVQGFAVDGDHAYLSCSEGLKNSTFIEYDITKATTATFNYNGTDIPMYILDKVSQTGRTTLPRMSEDIEVLPDGRVLMAFEAGAKKFYGGILPFAIKDIRTLEP
ncbi:MAG: hypothetical protein J5626_02770 [Lachnospiraceae bacterium]|nr:hypothetical protein [Lachnospiraceae bacterium]